MSISEFSLRGKADQLLARNHIPARLTASDRDEITAAMVGVIDRYCGMDPIDMSLARELGAECCRIIEARERAGKGGAE